MKPSAVTVECADKKKKPLSMIKKTRRCRFLGGDNQNGGFTGEQLRFPCKLRRYICARCGKLRGVHRHAGVSNELLPPRKRSVFRRLVQFEVNKKEKREKLEILTRRAVTKGKRTPGRKSANVVWAGLSESLRVRIDHRCEMQ